jgi:hypothetical protein
MYGRHLICDEPDAPMGDGSVHDCVRRSARLGDVELSTSSGRETPWPKWKTGN